jgi:Ni,Fe-hydrogenase III component G
MVEAGRIKEELSGRFGFPAEGLRDPRPRRFFAEAPVESFREVFDFAVGELGFGHLCTITGLDEGESLAAYYHLARPDGVVLSLKTRVPRASPKLHTISDAFPGCVGYERELVDLLGFEIEGLPPGKRYPLPDDWPADEHPLRKDWKKPQKPATAEEKSNG